ncbi:MAG: hypothetical protein KC492_20685, partial [Myxococcales bacterium]|nr:hypothetical protein [Myxococcales bacterium]
MTPLLFLMVSFHPFACASRRSSDDKLRKVCARTERHGLPKMILVLPDHVRGGNRLRRTTIGGERSIADRTAIQPLSS